MSEFDKKISALTGGSAAQATDEYVIARGGSNFKITGANVAAAATAVGTLSSLAVTGAVTLGADVVLSRGAADRLDLASGDSLNLVSGSLKIAGNDVLSATTLGSGVTASSLTSVGTLTALTVTGDLTVDTDTLKVNSTDNRVGIGTATPFASAKLDVRGPIWSVPTINTLGSFAFVRGGIIEAPSLCVGLNLIVEDTGNNFYGLGFSVSRAGDVEAMKLDSSGNLGVGVTPSAWEATRKAIQISPAGSISTASNNTFIGTNFYSDGTSKYVGTGVALLYGQEADGAHKWYNAASGTAGNTISFTERARITAGGYLKASNDGTYLNATGAYHELRQTADDSGVIVTGTNASLTNDVLQVRATRNTTDNTFFAINYFNDGAAAYKFRVADSGNVTNTNNSYGSLSDAKLKQDIKDAGSEWDDIKAVRFRKYRLKADVAEKGDEAKYMLGVIAQELREVSPGLVDSHPDTEQVEVEVEVEKSRPVMHEVEEIVTDAEGVESVVMKSVPMLDEDGKEITETYTETETRTETRLTGTETLAVKQSILLIKAAVALQEAMARIESLEARLDSLENL